MAAIWHASAAPSFLAPPPSFSFHDIAQLVVPAPASYELARARYGAWERRMGGAWFQHNAQLAQQFWQAKKPWWLF